jgi:hypothetical protein
VAIISRSGNLSWARLIQHTFSRQTSEAHLSVAPLHSNFPREYISELKLLSVSHVPNACYTRILFTHPALRDNPSNQWCTVRAMKSHITKPISLTFLHLVSKSSFDAPRPYPPNWRSSLYVWDQISYQYKISGKGLFQNQAWSEKQRWRDDVGLDEENSFGVQKPSVKSFLHWPLRAFTERKFWWDKWPQE